MKKGLTLLFFVLMAFFSKAQDSASLPKKLSLNGYIKDIQSMNFDKSFKELVAGNLIHNRLNIKWKPTERLTTAIELRNRLFWGEEIKYISDLRSGLRNEIENINLQKVWIQQPGLLLHTNIERLYIDYHAAKWNARIGRQRINWGVTTNWNPNDIFNSFNFLDFDYEERPGMDGGKFQYLFSDQFNIEMAYANTGKKNGNVAAVKYALNKWKYDMQLITGLYKDHFTAGAGWAGNIKEAGFKGEAIYFLKHKDSASHFNMALEWDYLFKNGWYINTGFLFNNRGISKTVINSDSINLRLSPENLMPTKWNLMVSTAREINPLLSANLGVLFAPGTKLLLLLPSITYNLATNLDINFIWQSYFASLNSKFQAISHHCYLRLKWSM